MKEISIQNEPPLHKAVLEGNLTDLIDLKDEPEYFLQKNHLELTAYELALLLNDQPALEILGNHQQISYKVQFSPNQKIEICDRATFVDHFGIHFIPTLIFQSYTELVHTICQCPWILSKSFFGEGNRKLGEKYKRELFSGYTADVSIRFIDNTIGWGIFAERELFEGEYVGEYAGVVRTFSRISSDLNAYCFHYPTRFFSFHPRIIDASGAGNITRFINHSDIPNLFAKKIVDRGIIHVGLFTNTSISKGEQLLLNYGPDYWKRRAKKELKN